jgi:hypothetical protein
LIRRTKALHDTEINEKDIEKKKIYKQAGRQTDKTTNRQEDIETNETDRELRKQT